MAETLQAGEQFKKKYKREFRVELCRSENPQQESELRKDIISYVGEYRCRVRKFSYNQKLAPGEDGKIDLFSEDNTSITKMAQKAVDEAIEKGFSRYKVDADNEGIDNLKTLVEQAQDGDFIIQASPPDARAGYTYGFFYLTQVRDTFYGKSITTEAIRVNDGTTLQQFNNAYTSLLGEDLQLSNPNDFIRTPTLLSKEVLSQKGLEKAAMDALLEKTFGYAASKKDQSAFAHLTQEDSNFLLAMDQFIDAVKQGSSDEEKNILFNIIENYAESWWGNYLDGKIVIMPQDDSRRSERVRGKEEENRPPQSIDAMRRSYGQTPKEVKGTCPILESSGSQRADIFGRVSSNGKSSTSETCAKIECRQCGWTPAEGEKVGSVCPTCDWAPGKPVDKDWDKKKGQEEPAVVQQEPKDQGAKQEKSRERSKKPEVVKHEKKPEQAPQSKKIPSSQVIFPVPTGVGKEEGVKKAA